MLSHDAEHEKASELMPEYPLGSLDLEERLLIERHVSRCPPCSEELEQYKAVAGLLPEGMRLVDPPADLKGRILAQARIRADQSAISTTDLNNAANANVRDLNAAAGRPQPVVTPKTSWQDRFAAALGALSPAWGLAVLAVIVLLAISTGLLWTQVNRLKSTSTLRTVALQGVGPAAQATGTLVISMDGEHGTLVVDALPVLDESQEYQLWLRKGDVRVSGGVFSVSKDGYGAVWVHAPDALASYESAGITIEPAGGSDAPTGEKVLGGDL